LTPAAKLVSALLTAYKRLVSPHLPPSCRYVPTCSEYAMEAVERFGALRGGWLALARVLRCHPFVRGGYDPVIHREMVHRGMLHRDTTSTSATCSHG
jgi:uncharacterized protein